MLTFLFSIEFFDYGATIVSQLSRHSIHGDPLKVAIPPKRK